MSDRARNELELTVELGLPLPAAFWARFDHDGCDRALLPLPNDERWHVWRQFRQELIHRREGQVGVHSVVEPRGQVVTLCAATALPTPISTLQLMEDVQPEANHAKLCATCYHKMSAGQT